MDSTRRAPLKSSVHHREGYLLADLVLASACIVIVVLPLLVALDRALSAHEEVATRLRLRGRLDELRRGTRIGGDEIRDEMGERVVRRGESRSMPARDPLEAELRVTWSAGEEVDWIVWEVRWRRHRETLRVSLPGFGGGPWPRS